MIYDVVVVVVVDQPANQHHHSSLLQAIKRLNNILCSMIFNQQSAAIFA
jgi:nitrate reductase NapAB chaperone NapD